MLGSRQLDSHGMKSRLRHAQQVQLRAHIFLQSVNVIRNMDYLTRCIKTEAAGTRQLSAQIHNLVFRCASRLLYIPYRYYGSPDPSPYLIFDDICLSVCLSACPFVCPSLYLSTCLSIHVTLKSSQERGSSHVLLEQSHAKLHAAQVYRYSACLLKRHARLSCRNVWWPAACNSCAPGNC